MLGFGGPAQHLSIVYVVSTLLSIVSLYPYRFQGWDTSSCIRLAILHPEVYTLCIFRTFGLFRTSPDFFGFPRISSDFLGLLLPDPRTFSDFSGLSDRTSDFRIRCSDFRIRRIRPADLRFRCSDRTRIGLGSGLLCPNIYISRPYSAPRPAPSGLTRLRFRLRPDSARLRPVRLVNFTRNLI